MDSSTTLTASRAQCLQSVKLIDALVPDNDKEDNHASASKT